MFDFKKKENRRKLELSLLCGLVIAVMLSVTSFGASCGNIRNEVLRMHVIANSDSAEDQAVKLKVRDAVLAAGPAPGGAADELGKASRLVGRRRFCGAHLVERDLCALLGSLPGGFTASQASADYDDFLPGFS